ncbi:MAG TPA: hypothetical protein VLC50_00030 [Actinomycetes bacterium]|nr:hypothetical protein [Actinomycetes bacterium]
MPAQLVVMGSGETAPTMVKVHREVFSAVPAGRAVALDSPYGFQVNADDLSVRTARYFHDSVGHDIEVIRWRREARPPAAEEAALASVRTAAWVFAGPGSPTYALSAWHDTPMARTLADVPGRGGTLLLASAAAVATGAYAVPVYEVYKCGADPVWHEGLDVLGAVTGVHAAVIPHWDNHEGGTYDTRFCYLGEGRLQALEDMLPAETVVLGVDEHTALLVDLESRTARVLGNRTVTVRRGQAQRVLAAGAVVPMEALGDPGERHRSRPSAAADEPSASVAEVSAPSLRGAADEAEAAFEAALAGRDVDRCVHLALELEQTIVDWSADTNESDDTDHARRVLRTMLTRLGELARVGARDPREVVGPYVELALDLRERARTGHDWAASDAVRDRLALLGIEVRDTPDGVEWVLAEQPAEPAQTS